MADPSDTAAAAADPATAWYLGLLEREAGAAARPVKASELADHLQLRPQGAAMPGSPTTYAVVSKLSDCSVRLNALSGDTISWYLDFLATGGTEAMPPDAALALATEVAQPPDDAVPAGAGYETMADRCVFRARWRHVVAGVPVEGDYIEVLINGKHQKAFSLSKVWREPRVGRGAIER
jgi:hypothetical protein